MKKTSLSFANATLAFRSFRHLLCLLPVVALAMAGNVQAATQTWNATAVDGNWVTGGNWVSGTPPGSLNPPSNATTNTDIANFNAVSNFSTITIDNIRFISGMTFTTGAGAYTFTGGQLDLNNNGTINVAAGVTNAQVFNNTWQVHTASSTNGVYSFVNNSTTTSATMTFGAATDTLTDVNGRPVTLTLDGTNTGLNTISSNLTDASGAQAVNIITKQGAGTWVLSGANTFTGSGATLVGNGIQINGGMLVAANNSALGSATGVADSVSINNTGTLQVKNSITLDNSVQLHLNNGGAIQGNGTNTINSTITVANGAGVSSTISTVGSSDVLTLGNAANDLAGGAADTVIHIAGPGTVFESQSTSYAGSFSIDAGTYKLGTANAIGGAGTVAFGASSTGKLQLNGNSISVTSLNTNATPGSAVIENGTAGATTLTVNNAVSNTFAGVMQDGAAGTLALTKTGVGSLTLGGANTYTGATSISGGTVTLASGASLGNTAVSVNSTLALIGSTTIGSSAGGSLTLNAGSTLSMLDSSIGTLTLANNTGAAVLTTAPSGTAPTIKLDVAFNGADELLLTGASSTVSLGSTVIQLNGLSTAGTVNLTDTLISDAAGNLIAGDFSLASGTVTIGGTAYNATLSSSTSSAIILTLSALAGGDYYWAGGASNSWNTSSNFVSAATGGTTESSAPNGAVNVHETATSAANASQQLDNAFTVNSLTFNTTGISIAPGTGGSLTINAGTGFTDGATYLAGTGLVVQTGSSSISAPIALGASQTWEIDPSSTLTVSGAITDGGLNFNLTKTGTGTLIFSGTNNYGGTTVTVGTLQLGTGGSLQSATALTVNGGTFDLNGNNQTVGNLADGGVSTGTITSTSGTPTFTVNNPLPDTFSGLITGSLNLSKQGTGSLTLSNANTYSGSTSVGGGTLVSGITNVLPTATALTVAGTGATFDLAGHNQTIASLQDGSVNTGTVTSSSGTPTLTINGTSTFAGTLSGSLALNLTGGTVTLGGTNTFNGATSVGASTTLQVASALALQNSAVTNSGAIGFTTPTAATFGSLAGSGNITLTNGSSAGVVLTTGNNNSSTTYSGIINGAGGLTKTGTGTMTLTGTNSYTGTTQDAAGILVIGVGGVINGGAANVSDGAGGIVVNGGSLTASAASGLGNGGGLTVNSGTATFASTLNSDNNNGSNVSVTGGTLNVNGLSNSRTSNSFTTQALAEGGGGTGILISGGTVNDTGVLGIGTLSGANSSSYASISAGAFNVSGVTTITNSNGGRFSILAVRGGTFTSTNAGAGVIIGGVFANVESEFYVAGGTASVNAITFGDGVQTSGVDVLNLASGALYVGSGGINVGGAGQTNTITLNGGILGALADWSSSMNMTVAGGTIQTADSGGTGHTITLSGNLTGTNLVETGSGILNLTGSDTFSGSTSVTGGTLSLANLANLGAAGLDLSNGTFRYTGGSATVTPNIVVATGTTGTLKNTGGGVETINGAVSKDGSVLNFAGGAFVVNGVISGASANSDLNVTAGSIVGLTAANTYNGPTSISGGSTLLTGVAGALPTSPTTDLTLGTGTDTGAMTNTLDLVGTNQTVNTLNSTGSGTNQVISSNGSASTPASGSGASASTGSLTVDNASGTDTFSGSLGGSGSANNFRLAKSGSGKLALTGSNTYTGGTTVNGGTLETLVSGATGTGQVTVNSGATWVAKGTVTTSGVPTGTAVTIAGNLDLSSASGGTGTSTLTLALQTGTSVNLVSGATFAFDLGVNGLPGTSDHVDVTGGTLNVNSQNFSDFSFTALTGFGAGTYNLFVTDALGDLTGSLGSNLTGTIDGFNATLSIVNSQDLVLTVAPAVPEPSTWAMMIAGFALLVFVQARRRRS